jgi:formate dehydrogenase maturation protein FdhE
LMSGFSWDRRIARTSELLQSQPSVAELLKFYQRLVRFQKNVYESVASFADHDVSLLVPHFAALLALVKEAGSADLKAAAATLEQSSPEGRLELLRAVWQHEVESHELSPESVFFANALLQPFAEYLAESNNSITESSPPLCPFCGSRPQLAVLRP